VQEIEGFWVDDKLDDKAKETNTNGEIFIVEYQMDKKGKSSSYKQEVIFPMDWVSP
jgi:hypothetical protein